MKEITILSMLILLFFCFCCTTKNSKPYSAKKTKAILSKLYNIEIEIIDEQPIKPTPCAKTRYTLRKLPENFIFTAVASVDYHGEAWVIGNYIDDNYARAWVFYCNQKAAELAEKYNLKMTLPQSIEDEPKNKIFLKREPLYGRHGDLHPQLQDVTNLFFELQKLYDFHVSSIGDYLRVTNKLFFYDPSFDVYFMPEEGKSPQMIHSYSYFNKFTKVKAHKEFFQTLYSDPNVFFSNLESWYKIAYYNIKY